MIVGRALETTVEDRNATNIASNIPESASRIWRWLMRPCCSTGAWGSTDGCAAGAAPARASGSRVVVTVLLGGSRWVVDDSDGGSGDDGAEGGAEGGADGWGRLTRRPRGAGGPA